MNIKNNCESVNQTQVTKFQKWLLVPSILTKFPNFNSNIASQMLEVVSQACKALKSLWKMLMKLESDKLKDIFHFHI